MIISSQQLSSLDLQEKTMSNIALISPFSFLFLLLALSHSFFNLHAEAFNVSDVGPLVRKDQRRSLVVTEYGEVTATDISDGIGLYHIQFITLEPNSLFLPVLLHADMFFYVHTGSGRLSWAEDDDNQMKRVNLRRGDIYMLRAGSIFYVNSSLEPERKKLRIHAMFSNTPDDSYDPLIGAYSSISNLVRGFDKRVLRAAFKVPEEVIEEIIEGTPAPAIVHAVQTREENFWELEARFLKVFLGGKAGGMTFNKKKKTRAYNILDADPDFENCNGWSLTVTGRNANLLKGSNIGLFMVNLTKGSMMGPHWNPMATEIAIVLQGQGMVRVICSSSAKQPECKNMRFMVKEGDAFAVPRFHPMAQISFNNDSFVFMGFSTTRRRNHPQFLAGRSSVLQTLDKQVLAVSFNVTNSTIDNLLSGQAESFILECTSCAEEEKMILEEEIEREREEEEARKREEEEREREEREREEEEARKREEEARKREEEKEREEEREREEEEARKREEEEARKRQEEEDARRREEEEERREEEEAEREQEEERRRREEEKEQRQQEEARREREERESERREREREEEEEEEEERQKEEEKRRQEEAEWEEEETRSQEERRRRQEEEARREREIQEPAGRQPEQREEQRRQNEKATSEEQEEEDSREGGRKAPRMRSI
ncbi:hypothetical protein I3843_01G031500 [Carya illinoinensis]|nr:hypothetical protein I3843_01G031500 [Carya illinoinensis]